MDLTASTPLITTFGGMNSIVNVASQQLSTSKRRTNGGYKFPILKSTEIIQCLKELSLSCTDNNATNSPLLVPVLTKDELDEPQHCKEKVRQIFIFLLSYCAGKDEQNISGNNTSTSTSTINMLNFIQSLDYPELHPFIINNDSSNNNNTNSNNTNNNNSFIEVQFFLSLRTLMEQCLYYEFSWRDLHIPVSKRFKIQLSALINLVKYLEGEQIKIFNELNGPRSELILALEEAQSEQDELKATFQLVEDSAQKQRIEMDSVIQECEELEIEIARNNRLQAASRDEAASIKKRVTDLNDQVQTAIWALQEMEADENKLKQQVVQNPEQYTTRLSDATNLLQKEKDECTKYDTEIKNCKAKYSNALKAYQDVSNCLKEMEELHIDAKKYHDIAAKLVTVRTTIDTTMKQTNEATQELIDCERDISRAEEKLKSSQQHHVTKMKLVHDSLMEAQKQLLLSEKDRRDALVRIENREKDIQRSQCIIDNERIQTDNEISILISKYKIIETNFIQQCQQQLQVLSLQGEQQQSAEYIAESSLSLNNDLAVDANIGVESNKNV